MDVISLPSRRISKSDVYELIPIGDIRLGNAGCELDRLESVIEHIRKEKRAL